MKAKIISIVICMLVTISTAMVIAERENENENDCLKSYKDLIPIDLDFDLNTCPAVGGFPTAAGPSYSFVKEPTALIESHYDYQPGSYCGHPIKLQTENGDGKYLTFHAQEGKHGTRKQYYAYVDSSNNIQTDVIYENTRQGYGSIGIHPATGNCIASFHELPTDTYTTSIIYDDFDESETAGNWQDAIYFDQPSGNEYIWPYIYVGSSPVGDNFVRIYQLGKNYVNNKAGFPCEDVLLHYIDIENSNGVDMSGILDKTNWESVTIFSDWREKSIRPFQSFAVDPTTPGRVAFVGNCAWLKGDLGNMPVDEGMFVWESNDYGETWDYENLHTDGPESYLYLVDNIPEFEIEDGVVPDKLEVQINGDHSAPVYDGDGNLHYPFMALYGVSSDEGTTYWPDFQPQMEAVWDGSIFTFHEVPELPGSDPSGHSVPWDTNNLYPISGWSTYQGAGSEFHENAQKQAVNRENGWMVQVWVDGTYSELAKQGIPEYADYDKHPMIYISVSTDNGNSWSEPIMLTDVNNQLFNFSDQITVYPYISEEIIDAGDGWGQLDMFYFDDNKFGSGVQGMSTDLSGDITYCSIKINFAAGGAPSLEIGEIEGGIGVSTTITNTGTEPATNVEWSITLDGDIVFLGGTTTGAIANLDVGETVTIKSGFPLGFGDIDIEVSAQSIEGSSAVKTAAGKLLLFYIQLG